MTPMKIDYSNSKIILSSAFQKKAFTVGTQEYNALQAVRQNHPGFALVVRQFKTNTKQERYRGLTYPFMREHIAAHEADPKPVLDELEEMIGISKCHSVGKRYPTIKAWFLRRYPDLAEFGMNEEELTAWRDKLVEEQKSEEAYSQQPAA